MAQSRELGAGAWSYFGDPRAISHDGHTFTGWISTVGHVWVARLTAGGKLSKQLIFRGLGRDDHNNPSLVFLPDGRIVAFFSPHSGRFLPPAGIPSVMRYRISEHPHSIESWGPVHTVPTNAAGELGYTYPNPIQQRGKLWLFWRGGDWNPTFSYTENRIDWVPARELVRSAEGQRPYAKYVGDGKDEHPRDLLQRPRPRLRQQPLLLPLRGQRPLQRRRREDREPLLGADPAAEPRPGLQVLVERRPGVAARHRADVGGPAADRLHAPPGRRQRQGHVLVRLPQRREVDQPQDRRGRRRPPVVHLGRRDARPRGSALRLPVAHDRRWNQVEQWFTPDNGRTWTTKRLTDDPNHYSIRPVTPRGLRGANRVLFSRGDETTKGYTNYRTRIHALDF